MRAIRRRLSRLRPTLGAWCALAVVLGALGPGISTAAAASDHTTSASTSDRLDLDASGAVDFFDVAALLGAGAASHPSQELFVAGQVRVAVELIRQIDPAGADAEGWTPPLTLAASLPAASASGAPTWQPGVLRDADARAAAERQPAPAIAGARSALARGSSDAHPRGPPALG